MAFYLYQDAGGDSLSSQAAREMYQKLIELVMPNDQLKRCNYPHRDPANPELCMATTKDGQRLTLQKEFASSYVCSHCKEMYSVDKDGIPLMTEGICSYHCGFLRFPDDQYPCCGGGPSAVGCRSNIYHVHEGELELDNYKGFVETQPKPEREPDRHGIYALDCEMCYTTYGLELTRVTLVDHDYKVVYDKLVKPRNPILDYFTASSGISESDLNEVSTRLTDVQRDLLEMFSNKTIIIGHGLDSDMKALKMFHEHFIDTAQLFPHKRGLPYKKALRTIAKEILGISIQRNKTGHDSKEDACVALKLVMWKANQRW
uniref:Putative exonuclease GOR-like protein n=1 Tax=Aceria tosichella TaxID=561515 RepID=A0A6G1SCP5_9ACAR